MSSLSKNPIEISLAGKIFVSVATIVGVSSIIGYPVVKRLGMPIKVYLPPILFANTGNMGLPLILFAFGDKGFSVGILYMVSITMLHYTVGIMLLNYDKSRWEIFKLPLIYAAAAGALLSVYEVQVPTSISRATSLLGEACIPTMIFTLGYKLSEVQLTNLGRSFLAGGMRVMIGVTLGVLVAWALKLDGLAAKVVILQSAMPPAIFNFVLAEKYKQDSKTVASIILAGTIISILTTPLIIAFLLR